MRGLKFRPLGNKASASVELALMSVFFLLPLFGGGVDLIEIIAARAQVNTALRALYSFDWTNPSLAATAAPQASNIADLASIVATINAGSLRPVSFPASTSAVTQNGTSVNGSSYFVCIPSGSTTGNTLTQAAPCGTGYIQQTWVTYQVNSSVYLPVPMPFVLSNPLTISASGAVQVQ